MLFVVVFVSVPPTALRQGYICEYVISVRIASDTAVVVASDILTASEKSYTVNEMSA